MNQSNRIATLLFLYYRKETSLEEEQELLEWRQKSPTNDQTFLELGDREYVRTMMADLYKRREVVFDNLKVRFSYLSEAKLSEADDLEDEESLNDFPGKDIEESGLPKLAFWESLLSDIDFTKINMESENDIQSDSLKAVKPLSSNKRKPRYVHMFLRAAIFIGITVCLTKFFSNSDSVSNRFKAGFSSSSGLKLAMDDFHRGYLDARAHITRIYNAKGEPVFIFPGMPKSPKDKNYTLVTNTGNETILQLPDGSQIWLNPESAINFTANFNQDTIYVKLEGEVYFEIGTRSTKHFNISSDFALRTEGPVLNAQHLTLYKTQSGSRFCLTAYRNDSVISVNMISGNIKGRLDPMSYEQAVDIDNNLHSTYANGKILVNNVNDSLEILGLKNGEIYFKDAGIKTIMATVTRWYKMDIKYPRRIPDNKLNLRVPLDSKLSVIFDSLKKQGIHLYEQGGTITVLN